MRRLLVIACLAALLLPLLSVRTAGALECQGPDLVALVFDNGEINKEVPDPGIQTVSLLLLNPSAETIAGWELGVAVDHPEAWLFLSAMIWGQGPINLFVAPEFMVGLGVPYAPDPDGVLHLADLTYFVINTTRTDFFLHPIEYASVEGQIVYADGADVGNLVQMTPISGSFDLPVARANGDSALTWCSEPVYDLSVGLTVSCAGDQDTGNAAAVVEGATDGYDPDYDVPEPPVPPYGYVAAWFEHPDWPVGSRYEVDVRAPYDPLQMAKVWPITVETDLSGPVSLDFMPNLPPGSLWPLLLRDLTTGEVHDLRMVPSLAYPGGDRRFELIIGQEPEAGFDLLVDATAGGLSDPGNRAATRAGATDGYDGDYDVPEPPPPPADYVRAYWRHPDWPLGERYHDDVRALYDPTTELKVWPLSVESDQSGGVSLTFRPGFSQADGYGLFLRDPATGTVKDLWPTLSHLFYPVPGSRKDFEVLIGPYLSPPPLEPSLRLVRPGWSLIGFPLVPPAGQGTLQDVVLDDVTGHAFLYGYPGGDYEVAPATAPAAPGQGYWLGTDQPFTWTMEGEPDLDGVAIPLRRGWTIVGYPLWFVGDLAQVQVDYDGQRMWFYDAALAGHVAATAYGYDDSTDAYRSAQLLQPWHGYWVAGLRAGVSLWFDYPNFLGPIVGAAEVLTQDYPPQKSWRVVVGLSDGVSPSRQAEFGIHPLATAGFDAAFDAPAPPKSPAGAVPRLVFLHPEWEVATGSAFLADVVAPEDAASHSWPAEVRDLDGRQATLSWDASSWPPELDLQIYLPDQNRVVVPSMRQAGSWTSPGGSPILKLEFRTTDFLTGIGDLPGREFRLTASPNPSNPQTVFACQLASPGRAEVRIYDLRGALLRRLPLGDLPAGEHKIRWDGRDDRGRQLASGVAFAALYLDGRKVGATTKVSLLR